MGTLHLAVNLVGLGFGHPECCRPILTGEVHDGMTVRVHAGSDRLVFEPLVTGVAQAA